MLEKTVIFSMCAVLCACSSAGAVIDRPIRVACGADMMMDGVSDVARLQRDPAYAEALISRGTKCRRADISGRL